MISDNKSKYKSWSNLKKQMNDLLCDSLKDKISYFYTNYHEVHNAYGRATINYNKKEMIAFSWVEMYVQEQEVSQLYREGKAISYGDLEKEKWMPECKLCDADFIHSLTIFLKTDIAESLHSENYLLRILAYLDRRIGKRTLIKIKDEVDTLPEWVQQFYRLRCEADGIVSIQKQMAGETVMDLSFSDLMQVQRELYERHKDKWAPREPQFGKEHILYMIEEIGETIAIIKKKGDAAITEDPAVREAFLEELADILMYYTDILLCYHVTPEEISEAFLKKSQRNLGRDYAAEYKELYHG